MVAETTLCSSCTSQATQLVNHILNAKFLPRMPLGVLSGVGGLQEAAVGKLLQQQRAQLGRLQEHAEEIAAAVKVRNAPCIEVFVADVTHALFLGLLQRLGVAAPKSVHLVGLAIARGGIGSSLCLGVWWVWDG